MVWLPIIAASCFLISLGSTVDLVVNLESIAPPEKEAGVNRTTVAEVVTL